MENPALVAALAACAGAAAALICVAVVQAVRGRRSRGDLEARLAAARQEVDDLRRRVDELTAPVPAVVEPQQADFVITHVGEESSAAEAFRGVAVPDRLVLSATLGEPLVKAAAFTHGLRRALSARSRNRIWFEVRREVRASRRRRRQLRKRLEREYRARLRSADDLTLEGSVVEGRA
jgi:NADPH:quinone reductase-like Zn-dependent oxidoreductase